MVLGGGLEPPRVAPYAPQTYVSADSTTRANGLSHGNVVHFTPVSYYLTSMFFKKSLLSSL